MDFFPSYCFPWALERLRRYIDRYELCMSLVQIGGKGICLQNSWGFEDGDDDDDDDGGGEVTLME